MTGYLNSAALGNGRDRQSSHDDRYAIAEDYMQLVYKLWEGSWADDAVAADSDCYARPERVRRVTHAGPHFRTDAIHLSEPSP